METKTLPSQGCRFSMTHLKLFTFTRALPLPRDMYLPCTGVCTCKLYVCEAHLFICAHVEDTALILESSYMYLQYSTVVDSFGRIHRVQWLRTLQFLRCIVRLMLVGSGN